MGRLMPRLAASSAVAVALSLSSAAQAAMPVAPLTSGADIVRVAEGCGAGEVRGPGGRCHMVHGAHPAAVVVVPGVALVHWGEGRPGWRWDGHCWRGPAGALHCH